MSASDLFADVKVDGNYALYHAEIQIVDKLIGGIPKDPDTILKWLKARMEMDDRALIELSQTTALEMEAANKERPSADELMTEVARKFEGGNGFKTIDGRLVYEGRCLKSGLKEAMNISYPGVDFPGKPTRPNKKGEDVEIVRKGLLRFASETVFVEDLYIDLGVTEPDGTEQRIKQLNGPKGPYSAIGIVDYVVRPKLTATISVLDDFFPRSAWARVWKTLEKIGLGSDRARGDGKFELVEWEHL